MKNILRLYIKNIECFSDFIGKAISWLTSLLVLVICVDVLRRYAFDKSSNAILDIERYLFALIFLLATSYTLKQDKHVRVDVFYTKFSDKTKGWINLLGSLIFLTPFCIVVIYTSYNFTAYSFQLNEGSAEPGGLPARYLIKGAIPLAFIFLLLQAIALAFKSLLIILGEKTEKKGGIYA